MRRFGLLLAFVLGFIGCGGGMDGSVQTRQSALTGPNHPNSVVAQKVADTPVTYPYTFVLMADAHHPSAEPVFTTLLSQILTLTPTPVFVAVIGDMTDQGKVDEIESYLSIVDPYPIPLFSIIGNHEQWFPYYNYTTYFGPTDFSFDFGKSRFVALNDIVPGDDGLTKSQINYLNGQLNNAAHPDRYVLMHASPPIITPPWGSPPFKNAQAFYKSMSTYNVHLQPAGHIHEFRHLQSGNAHYLVTGGSGGAQDPPLENPPNQGIFKHFLLVTIQADGNSKVEVYRLGESMPASEYTVNFQTAIP